MKIISMLGKSKAGKDTSGQMLTSMGNGITMAFADKLKEVCSEMFNLPREQFYDETLKEVPTSLECLLCPQCKKPEVQVVRLDGKDLGECRLCKSIGALSVFKGKWTPRTILQFIGTEGFRKVDSGVWVKYALAAAKEHLDKYDFVVLTDCRFKSELEAVQAAGGEVWRIYRPETDKKKAGLAGHASEDEMDSIPDSNFQAVIQNDSTLETLRGRLQLEFNRYKKENFGVKP